MQDGGRDVAPFGHGTPAAGTGVDAPDAPVRTLADAMPQLVWTADGQGVVDYYNSRAAEYAGIATTPEGTWEWRPVVHPDDRALTVAAWNEAVATGSLYQCEHRVHMADGSYRWHLSRGVPVRQGGRVVKWYGTATDIHSLKSAEEALREAARHKDEFLAVLAHELRNPLAPIRNALELMRLHPLDEMLQRLHGMLDRQVGQMVRLVDDLLEISRISRGDIRIDPAPVAVATVIAAALETVAPALAAGGQQLDVTASNDELMVVGDAVRLSQAFGNLLSNAIKFTPPEGHIRVLVESTGRQVSVIVADSGVGIAPEMLERVFDMFAQVPSGHGRSSGGLGIGLALVRRIVELHGGAVTAASAGVGLGSTFVVTLPRLD